MFLCAGVGKHREKLTSFEMALRDAGLASLNLVQVSSILPPYCKLISKKESQKYLKAGQIIHCVLSTNSTNEPHRLVVASVGIAIPRDRNQYGYIAEHHCYGIIGEKVGEYAEDLAATMLATTIGVDFDPDKSYDEKKEIWKISGKIIRTKNITKSAIGDKSGLWTTVLAAAVLLP